MRIHRNVGCKIHFASSQGSESNLVDPIFLTPDLHTFISQEIQLCTKHSGSLLLALEQKWRAFCDGSLLSTQRLIPCWSAETDML
jgi:hypothetical protein